MEMNLCVMKTPDGTWTVRHESRDEQDRRVTNFLGEWATKEIADQALSAALRGEPLPASIERYVVLMVKALGMAEKAFDEHDFTRDGGTLLPDEFEATMRYALKLYREIR